MHNPCGGGNGSDGDFHQLGPSGGKIFKNKFIYLFLLKSPFVAA